MLKDAGASHVIVGHSERRTDHGETDGVVLMKAEAAWRAGLVAIVCIGETRAEREIGATLEILSRQIAGSVPAAATHTTVVIAYEPVWAIGTGLTPTVDDVAEAHAHIRKELGATHRRRGGAHAHPLWRLGQAIQRAGTVVDRQRQRCAGRRGQPQGRRFPGDRRRLSRRLSACRTRGLANGNTVPICWRGLGNAIKGVY